MRESLVILVLAAVAGLIVARVLVPLQRRAKSDPAAADRLRPARIAAAVVFVLVVAAIAAVVVIDLPH